MFEPADNNFLARPIALFSTLLRETKGEVALGSRLRAALERSPPSAPTARPQTSLGQRPRFQTINTTGLKARSIVPHAWPSTTNRPFSNASTKAIHPSCVMPTSKLFCRDISLHEPYAITERNSYDDTDSTIIS